MNINIKYNSILNKFDITQWHEQLPVFIIERCVISRTPHHVRVTYPHGDKIIVLKITRSKIEESIDGLTIRINDCYVESLLVEINELLTNRPLNFA